MSKKDDELSTEEWFENFFESSVVTPIIYTIFPLGMLLFCLWWSVFYTERFETLGRRIFVSIPMWTSFLIMFIGVFQSWQKYVRKKREAKLTKGQ